MRDLQSIADRVEIEALRGEFTDAVMMHDYDRLASLFTPDSAVRMPYINAEAVGREDIRAGVDWAQGLWAYHDRYRRTTDGWKFAERVYEIRYLDTTPLAGSALHTVECARGGLDG
jgi:hypothetical protein